MEYHTEQLAKHCRVCGKRLSKAKGKSTVYNCCEYTDQLQACFGVDVGKDKEGIHPKNLCNPCYLITKRFAKARQAGVPYTFTRASFTWTEHTHTCLVRLRIRIVCIHVLEVYQQTVQSKSCYQ